VTTAEQTSPPRSRAWTFGSLSLSGPVLLVAGNLPTQFGFPLLPWVSILLDLWCVASVLLGIIAIRVGRADATAVDRPRSARAGTALGTLALVVDGCLFLLWFLTPMSF
jgi:hypothetical protein